MAYPERFTVIYKQVEDAKVDVDVYVPKATSKPCPVLVNIHGGAFMLGSSRAINKDQIYDCLDRGWIVLATNHRLCPQVNLLEGPMADCRDLLGWIYDGGLQKAIEGNAQDKFTVDLDHVFAFGTSSGGTLALSLGFGVRRPVAGIFDMYGPCFFDDPFWTTPLSHIKVPQLDQEFLDQVFDESPVPVTGGASLEGQRPGPPDFTNPRQAFAFTQISSGNVLNAIFPSKEWKSVDPLLNVTPSFPPTFIVHGEADTMVPCRLSSELFKKLQNSGVKSGMRTIPGEEHTFAMKMTTDSETYKLQREGFDFLEKLIQ